MEIELRDHEEHKRHVEEEEERGGGEVGAERGQAIHYYWRK